MAELKPCPFCGGNVRFDVAYSYFRDIVIYCDSCDMVFTLDDCETTASEIAEAWNRRATMAEYIERKTDLGGLNYENKPIHTV